MTPLSAARAALRCPAFRDHRITEAPRGLRIGRFPIDGRYRTGRRLAAALLHLAAAALG